MTPITQERIQQIIEAALMVSGQPLNISALQRLFTEDEKPSTGEIRATIALLQQRYEQSGLELREVANGFRFQTKSELSPWLAKLWEERAPRYSRAFLETLAIIAYRQPITRAEIEAIRGVTVSGPIIRSLLEREWIKIVGYRDVPGKPGLYGTTKYFLDYFNLQSLTELPTLAEFKDLDTQAENLQVQLEINAAVGALASEAIPEEERVLDDDNIVAFNQQEDDDATDAEKATG